MHVRWWLGEGMGSVCSDETGQDRTRHLGIMRIMCRSGLSSPSDTALDS